MKIGRIGRTVAAVLWASMMMSLPAFAQKKLADMTALQELESRNEALVELVTEFSSLMRARLDQDEQRIEHLETLAATVQGGTASSNKDEVSETTDSQPHDHSDSSYAHVNH